MTPTLHMEIGDKRHWLTVSTGERNVLIDVYRANEAIYEAEQADPRGDVTRQWIADRLEVDSERLSVGQILEFQDVISSMVEVLEDHRKKKVKEIVSWLSSTLESQEATNNGASNSNGTGSTTTNEQPHGAHASTDELPPIPSTESMPTS